MKKYFYILLLLIFTFKAHSHTEHYKGIKKIEMEVFRNGELIGYSNYFFEHEDNTMTVKNYTNFKVKILGATIFSILSEAIEKYENGRLISFKSNTFQNKKKKYVALYYDQSKKKLVIDGSSYKGKADLDCVIGNWWNHKILKVDKQISPLSGSVKDQIVTFVGKENIDLYEKSYLTDHFKLKSKNDSLPNDKKLDFDVWYNSKNNIILKVSYKKLGIWEYKVRSFE